ncbi:MAG: hypothetical protein ACPG42_12425 [Alphaproteobacteria bacterium]
MLVAAGLGACAFAAPMQAQDGSNRMFTLLIDQYADRGPRFLVDVRDVAPFATLETALAAQNNPEAALRREVEAALDALMETDRLLDEQAEPEAAPDDEITAPAVSDDGTVVIVAAIPTIAVPTVDIDGEEPVVYGLPVPTNLPLPKPLPIEEPAEAVAEAETAITSPAEEDAAPTLDTAPIDAEVAEETGDASLEDPALLTEVSEADELAQAPAPADTPPGPVETEEAATEPEILPTFAGLTPQTETEDTTTAEPLAEADPQPSATAEIEVEVETEAEAPVDADSLPPMPKDRPAVQVGYQGLSEPLPTPTTEDKSEDTDAVQVISGSDAVALYDTLSQKAEASKGEGSSRSGRSVTVEVDDLSATFGASADDSELSAEEQWDQLMQDSLN